MVIKQEFRGKKIGRKMMLAAECFAAEKGADCVCLEAMGDSGGFYEKLGYKYEFVHLKDDSFDSMRMKKQLSSLIYR